MYYYLLSAVVSATLIGFIACLLQWHNRSRVGQRAPVAVPVSVNFHFLRTCNFECGFCFHTAKTTYIAPLEDSKRGILLLKNAGMLKLNFAGGEPFLEPDYLGALVVYAKSIGVQSVSIVTNGSLVTKRFMAAYDVPALH